MGDDTILEFVAPSVKSRRGRLEVYYRQRALHCLKGVPGLTWLFDEARCRAGTATRGDGWRPGILAALGRIDDSGLMLALARELCARKPKAKEAALMLRRVRTGRTPPTSPDALTDALRRTLNDYLPAHPDCEWATIEAAVLALLADVRASAEAEC